MAAIPLSDDYLARRIPVVTYTLIAVNVAVYLLSPLSMTAVWYASDALERACEIELYIMRWGAVPTELLSGQQLASPSPCAGGEAPFTKQPWVTAFTSQFLHGGPFHLLSNMVFLFVFGPSVEDRLGRVSFLLFSLATGAVAAYGFALGDPSAELPLVGASGAISGVLGAYLVVQFRSRVVSLLFGFFPIRLPGWAVVATFFVIDYLRYVSQDLLPGGAPGVAYGAHVYGFAAGVAGGLLIYRIRWRGGVRVHAR